MTAAGFPPVGVPSGTSILVNSSTFAGGSSRKASSSMSHPKRLEADIVLPFNGVVPRCMTAAPSTEEALEDLVHQKRGPDKRLEDGQQVLAERVGLLPEEDQRTNQAQRIDGVASTCAGLIHAALTIRGPCGIGHSHSPTV